MNENELRSKFVNVMRGWLGWSEANGKHRKIIDLYNTQRPLPAGYKVKYTDEWCATTVTAAGIKSGLQDIILGECSCSRMINKYRAIGRWVENDAYVPKIGDILMYHWDDSTNYASTDCKGSANHVGVVAEVSGKNMTIIEGNKHGAVATRKVQVNGRYIRGYCIPDYASKVTNQIDKEDDDMDVNRFKELWREMRKELQDNDCSAWSAEARNWAISNDIISGGDDGKDGKPNYMWHDVPTREQLVVLLYRFAQYMGKV